MTDDTPTERSADRIDVTDADGTVAVRKVVSKGERLAIEDDDTGVKLDALLLEGLSWQSGPAAVHELLDAPATATGEPVGPPASPERSADEGVELTISNEYAHVRVRPVTTEDGDAVEILTPGRNTGITLGAPSLRVLAAVEDTFVFSAWFETPFGPEDTPLEGPL